MFESLVSCYSNKRVASIFRDPDDTERNLTGYVARINDSEVLVAHITPYGLYDGYILLHADDILRVDYDGKYEGMIEKLYNLRGQSHPPIDTFDKDNDQILFSLLDFAMKNDLVISVCFNDNYISGTVKSYSNDYIYLNLLNDYGEDNGISTCKIDEMRSIYVDCEDNQKINLLRKNK